MSGWIQRELMHLYIYMQKPADHSVLQALEIFKENLSEKGPFNQPN